MKNQMVLRKFSESGESRSELHACGCSRMALNKSFVLKDAVIYTYFGAKEAEKAGWRMSDHRRFSQNGNLVWVCPGCVNKNMKLFGG